LELQRKIKPNQSQIKAALIVFRISFAFYVAKLIFELFRYSLWTKVHNGVPIAPSQLLITEIIEIGCWLFQSILLLLCGVFFLIWIHRAYSNLGQFQRLKYSENMSVISWFLPVFSWFGPFMIYSAIVSGFEEVLATQNFIRRDTRRHSLKNWWWVTWLIGGTLISLGFGYDRLNLFCSAISTAILMISNLLLISSLSDMKMMEEGIGNLKNVSQSASTSDDLLDDML